MIFNKLLLKKSLLCIFLLCYHIHFSQENGKYIFKLKETNIVKVGDSNNIFFDYDLDGDLDLIISGYNDKISDVTSTHTFLYTNDGTGNFTKDDRSKLMGIEYGKIDVGDIDNDGDLDLVIIGQELRRDREDGIVIYKNNKGVFNKIKKISCRSMYAKFINANNDNYADLVIEKDYTVAYYLNNKKGDFILKETLKGIEQPFEYGIVAFDTDNDGDDELLLQGTLEFDIESLTKFYKNNMGAYTSIPHNFQNTYQGAILPVDIDNDGDQDVFMTNSGSVSKNSKTSLLYINDKGQFKETALEMLSYNLPVSCFVDLDNDGDQDLIIMGGKNKTPNTYDEQVDIYLNTGNTLKLFKENVFPYLNQGSINAADIDGDGDQDILMTGYQGDNMKTLLYLNTLN